MNWGIGSSSLNADVKAFVKLHTPLDNCGHTYARARVTDARCAESHADDLLHGIHKAFFVLGALTILSTIIFRELKGGDGDSVSQHSRGVY